MPMGVYPRTYRPLEERFWSHVEKTETCWLWKPAVKSGDYGRIRVKGRGAKVKAHVLSYTMHVGPIPDGLNVLHHCDNPPCVRPDHLFVGTHDDNMKDKVAKGRQGKGERMGLSKLNPDLVRAIRLRLADGVGQRQTAREFKVSRTTVRWIDIGKTWKHVI
jgi:hypothetical protein